MESSKKVQPSLPMKLLPAYTGLTTIYDILDNPRAVRLLWLEILVNEHFDLAAWQQNSDVQHVQQAYEKACQWFTAYRSLIESMIPRQPLPYDSRPIDFREYRIFAEAIRFAHTHA